MIAVLLSICHPLLCLGNGPRCICLLSKVGSTYVNSSSRRKPTSMQKPRSMTPALNALFVFVLKVFILLLVLVQGLLCICLHVKATSICAHFLSHRKLTSPQGTSAAVVGVQRALLMPLSHSLPCSCGQTPLEYAISSKMSNVVAYLRSIGAQL